MVSQGANGIPPTNSYTSINPTLVVEHLVSLLEVTLGASRQDLERPGSLLSTSKHPDTVQRCTRFASESQVALYVQKDIVTADHLASDSDRLGISFAHSSVGTCIY